MLVHVQTFEVCFDGKPILINTVDFALIFILAQDWGALDRVVQSW